MEGNVPEGDVREDAASAKVEALWRAGQCGKGRKCSVGAVAVHLGGNRRQRDGGLALSFLLLAERSMQTLLSASVGFLRRLTVSRQWKIVLAPRTTELTCAMTVTGGASEGGQGECGQ